MSLGAAQAGVDVCSRSNRTLGLRTYRANHPATELYENDIRTLSLKRTLKEDRKRRNNRRLWRATVPGILILESSDPLTGEPGQLALS